MYSFLKFVLFFLCGTCLCDEWDDAEQRRFVELVPDLYLKYRRALDSSDENTVVFRRVLKNNKRYNIHLNKLKDVHGFKRHNLIIKEESDDNPLIYINNPVETKIPNPYLSINEFKDLLAGRVLRQREDFKKTKHETFATLKPRLHYKKHQNNVVSKTKLKKRRTRPKSIRNISKAKTVKIKIVNATETKTSDKVTIYNAVNNKIEQTSKVNTETTDVDKKTTNNGLIIVRSLLHSTEATYHPSENSSVVEKTTARNEHSASSVELIGTLRTSEYDVKNDKYITIATENTLHTNDFTDHILLTEEKGGFINNESADPNDKRVANISVFIETTPKTDTTAQHALRTNTIKDIENKTAVDISENVPNISVVTKSNSNTEVITEATNYKSEQEDNTMKETIEISSVLNLKEVNNENLTATEPITGKTTQKSTDEETTTHMSTKDYITEDPTTVTFEEFITESGTNEERFKPSSGQIQNDSKLTIEKSTTRRRPPVHTRVAMVTKRRTATTKATTVTTTTKKVMKRTTLARPLVFMGGWENS